MSLDSVCLTAAYRVAELQAHQCMPFNDAALCGDDKWVDPTARLQSYCTLPIKMLLICYV